ncbi:MAG: hypothetical protein PHV11_05240 [Candidatus Bipolaricaulis sp.]|nr:hypothetical protein [Candidatus Bipolaricaulis sp.]MDD5645876.1 hypothetical protein [Candidatus Bipolaricaulis sp.]
MQTTIYYCDDDAYLLKQVDAKGRRERKSRSAVILSILEQYFEAEKKLGEILIDLGVVTHADLAKGLELQQTRFTDKLLGDILLEEEIVTPEAVERALLIQGRGRQADDPEA